MNNSSLEPISDDKIIEIEFKKKEPANIKSIKNKLDRIETEARILLHLVNDIRNDIKNAGLDE